MEKQMRAERDKRAQILDAEGRKSQLTLEAEGEKAAAINKAEGERQSQILRAEGQAYAMLKVAEAEAETIKKITTAISVKDAPVNYLVAMRYIDTLKEMVSGKNNKVVYLPYEASGILSSIGGIKELFNVAEEKN
jgi:regulator of protease activity HflC (stomatin/prohibitin superfamily)